MKGVRLRNISMKDHGVWFLLVVASGLCMFFSLPESYTAAVLGVYAVVFTLGFLTRNVSNIWPASSALLIYLALAVFVLISGYPPFGISLGSVFALAGWEAYLFTKTLPESRHDPFVAAMKRKHLNRLAVVIGLSVSVIGLGTLSRFSLPFGLVVMLVLVAVWGLNKGIKLLQNGD
jgi:ribose/xylose/arabinose/galactoside ABC-type transport system permease subunit